MINEYINRVETAIKFATEDNTTLPKEIFDIPGMSSRENRILLNEMVKDNDKYLEIGVHKGSTFISALYGKNAKAVAIDNFSQFGGQETKNWFDQACNDHKIQNFTFINHDCFNLSVEYKELIKGANIYFYDGDHREEDQERALTYYFNLLSDAFIFIVDDYNHEPARIGTQKGLEITKAVIHKEWILNRSTTSKSWHNSLYIAVLSKP